ncbi:autotransporter-associated beta strand repeat-containing protein [Verrucomicrobium sp. BvORR106]|uniref:beta strand repeat-containing protein n=1 Tax=Verrucomicrobium sp. BvORR106 TaxID=1403819 RepID=UPI00056F518A|nr:autotransporter-associated beta strand repeat-containing protein [Verrucomicrobium sp. BvORR106]
MVLAWTLAPFLHGQSLYWDANTSADAAQDGGGTWKAGTGINWLPTVSSPSTDNQVWPQDPTGSSTIAIFGAGGALSSSTRTISVDGTVTTAGLAFRAIQLSGIPDYAYQLSGGTIQIANGGFIEVGQSASNTATNYRIDVNSAITGNNITLRRSVGATDLGLIQFRAANAWTGTLSLEGSFFVDIQNLASVSTLSSINVGNTATLVINYGSASPLNVALTLSGIGTSSRGAVRVDQSRTLSGPITLAGNTGISTGSVGVVATLSGNIGESGGSRTLQINTNNTAGTVVLSGNNTFTGGVEIVAGTLRMGSTGALNSSAPNLVIFSNNTNSKVLALNGTNTVAGGLTSSGGTGTITVQNSSTTAARLTINTVLPSNDFTYAGVITDGAASAALTLVKEGSGRQILTGTANTYTGGTILNGGVLRIAADGSLGAPPASFSASNLTFNGGTLQLATSINLHANRGLLIQAGGGTLDTAGNNSIYSGTISGSGVFTKAGTGTLALDSANTITGEIRVAAGTLSVRHNQALGSTAGETNVLIGAHLELRGGVTITGENLSVPHLIGNEGNNTWTGNVRGAVGSTLTFEATSGNLLVAGNVNASSVDGVDHTFSLDGASTGQISGVISNTVVLNKFGTGTWTLSGNNAITGGVAISAGTLILAHESALNAKTAITLTFAATASDKTVVIANPVVRVGALSTLGGTGASVVENASGQNATLVRTGSVSTTFSGLLRDNAAGGRLGLTMLGSGTQNLNTAHTYTGDTTLAGGTLQLQFGAASAPVSDIISASSTLVAAGGLLIVNGNTDHAVSQTFNGLQVTKGTSEILLQTSSGSPQNNLLNLGAINRTGGAINFVLPSGTQSATNGYRTTSSNVNGILGAWATVSGGDWATVSNGNIVAYSGYTNITNFGSGAGALAPLPDNAGANVKIIAGGTGGAITLADTGTLGITEINTLYQTATNSATISFGGSPANKILRLGASGGIMLSLDAGNLTIGSSPTEHSQLTAGGAADTDGELIFINRTTAADPSTKSVITVNSDIVDNGTGKVSVFKRDGGLLVLASTTNTYSGTTTIASGTVRIMGDGSLGAVPVSAAAANIVLGAPAAGSGPAILQWGASFALSANRGVLLEAQSIFDTQNFLASVNSIISGLGSIQKDGTGTLTLNGANTYAGITNVSVGTLVAGHNLALGTTEGGTFVSSAAILRLSNGVTIASEALTISGTGSNNNGNLQTVAGTTENVTRATWAGDITINNDNARLGTAEYGQLTVSGTIKSGLGNNLGISAHTTDGVVILSGANTYAGSTSVVRGTLRLGRHDALPTGTVLNVHSSDLTTDMAAFDLAGFNQTVSGLSSEQRSNTSNSAFKTTVTNSSGNVATLTVNQTTDRVYYGEITGSLNLVKTGTGKLTLETQPQALTNSYTGKTTVAGGTLALSGTGNIDGSTWVQIDSNAALSLTGRTSGNYEMINKVISGTGRVEGTLIVRGTSVIRPGSTGAGGTAADAGAGFGELTFENVIIHPYFAQGTPRLEMQLGGTTSNLGNPLAAGNASYFSTADSGGLYDTLQVNGTLGLNDNTLIRVTYGSGYTAGWGDVFNLLDWTILNLNGDGPDNAGPFTLASLDLSSMTLSDGNFWATDKFISDGIIYVAPEPSRMLLTFGGLAALTLRRRRRSSPV